MRFIIAFLIFSMVLFSGCTSGVLKSLEKEETQQVSSEALDDLGENSEYKELVCDNVILLKWLGGKPVDLFSELGKPDEVISLDGNTDCRVYGNLRFICNVAEEKITEIQSSDSKECNLAGIGLDKTKSELIEMMGEPFHEELDDEPDMYNMLYIYEGHILRFYFIESMSDKALAISLSLG